MRVLLLLAALAVTSVAGRTAQADPLAARTIFLNRCTGGCQIFQGTTNSHSNTSGIPQGSGPFTLTGFSHSDEMWNDFVECMRDVYLPYAVDIVTVEPGPSENYHEIMVAGSPTELGREPNVLGVSSSSGVTCTPLDNAITFAFANVHPADDPDYLCATAAQESGHSWGLDHEFECASPMTYLNACGGRQYFRNAGLPCGEFSERGCSCGGNQQNSHVRLMTVFGQGAQLPAPTMEITNPSASTTTVIDQFTISATASAARGLGHAELWFNGYKWEEKDGNFKARNLTYVFTAPPELPDGVIDVEVRVYDDLQVGYASQTRTVTKGSPCTTADTCALGQRCEEGRCLWDPPAGEMGAACAYPQFCLSGVCAGEICTESCFVGVSGDCPAEYECQDLGGGGSCQPTDGGGGGGGGCAADDDGSPRSMVIVLGLVGLVGLSRSVRRKKS
jgi:MYXO-CTERM domain-containing protein